MMMMFKWRHCKWVLLLSGLTSAFVHGATPPTPVKVVPTPLPHGFLKPVKGGGLPSAMQLRRALQKYPLFKSEFVEFHNGVEAARGKLYVARPHKMRLEYDPPETTVFVADGHWFVHYDRVLGQPSYFSLSDNPAAFLLEADVPLEAYIQTIEVDSANPERIIAVIHDHKSQGMSQLRLVFDRATLQCREWMGWSQEGTHIHVILKNFTPLQTIDPKLFQYKK